MIVLRNLVGNGHTIIRPRGAVYMTVYTAKSMVGKFKRSRSHNGGGRAATADGQAGVAAPPARRLSRGCAALSSAFQGVDRAHPGPRQGSTTGAVGRPRQRFGPSSTHSHVECTPGPLQRSRLGISDSADGAEGFRDTRCRRAELDSNGWHTRTVARAKKSQRFFG